MAWNPICDDHMREVWGNHLPKRYRDAYDKGCGVSEPNQNSFNSFGPSGFGRTVDLDIHNTNIYSGFDLINKKNFK